MSLFLINGLFLFLDRFLKGRAVSDWNAPRLANEFFGWEPSLNNGVAFGIPLPNWLIITLTIPIILLVAYLFYKNIQYPISNISLLLILSGALSNLCDRLIYHGTVDYFLLLTAVINLADVMIMLGFLLYLMQSGKIRFRRK